MKSIVSAAIGFINISRAMGGVSHREWKLRSTDYVPAVIKLCCCLSNVLDQKCVKYT